MSSTAYALRISSVPSGLDPITIGLFETNSLAGDHCVEREDLAGYFWNVAEVLVDDSQTVPEIFWTPEKVAVAIAAMSEEDA
jgi:hypothetical protein